MKKIILSMSLAVIGLAAYAQKPTSGNITTEIGFTNLIGAPANPATLNIPQAMFRVRYFFADNMAARVHFGFGTSTDKSSISTTPPAAALTAERTDKSTGFGVALGIEYHLAGTDKLSPYVGAEFGFGNGGMTTDITNSSNAAGTPTAAGDSYSTSGGKTTDLAFNAMIGADYYITEKVYIGAELGIGIFTSSKVGEAKTKSVSGGVTVEGTTPETTTTGIALAPNAMGQVRIGIILF